MIKYNLTNKCAENRIIAISVRFGNLLSECGAAVNIFCKGFLHTKNKRKFEYEP